MKRILLIALCLTGSVASADCFVRSNIKLTIAQLNVKPTDYQRIVVPDKNGSKCVMRYRVHIKEDWQTVEGIATAKTAAEACVKASDIRKASLLEEVTPNKVSSDTQMVCSDQPEIRVRRVRIGETIWESETDFHAHPNETSYFDYKRTRCRMFVERGARGNNLQTHQGIICKVDTLPDSKWRVIDKY